MIIQTLSFEEAWSQVGNYGEGYRNKFSYEGFSALFDYLENFSEETSEPLEFDFIAWCCDYTEYENIRELQANYTNIKTMEELQDKTQVIEVDSGSLEDGQGRFIIQNF